MSDPGGPTYRQFDQPKQSIVGLCHSPPPQNDTTDVGTYVRGVLNLVVQRTVIDRKLRPAL